MRAPKYPNPRDETLRHNYGPIEARKACEAQNQQVIPFCCEIKESLQKVKYWPFYAQSAGHAPFN